MQVYINNIVYDTRSFLDLLDKLEALFKIFLIYHISIKLTKLYFNNVEIALLDY